MNFIWRFEDLSELCRHKNPQLRQWAIDRLSALYREKAGDIALELISDENDAVAREAADHFLIYPVETRKAGLLNLYEKKSGVIAGGIANVLAKLKYTRLIHAFKKKYKSAIREDLTGYALSLLGIAAMHEDESKEMAEASLKTIIDFKDYGAKVTDILFMANLVAGTDIKTLLNFCFSQPGNPGLAADLLGEIGRSCGSWYGIDDITEEPEKNKPPSIIEESLDYLETNGLKDTKEKIERFFKKGKYDEVINEIFHQTSFLLDAVKAECGEKAFGLWSKGRGKPRQNISAITAFRDSLKGAPDDFRKYIAQTALSVFARLIEYRGLIGFIPEKTDTDRALEVFLQERGDVEEDERLMDILMDAGGRDKLAGLCLKHFKEHPGSWANPRITRFLGRTKNMNALAALFGTEHEYDGVWKHVISAVKEAGPSALEIVRPALDNFDANRTGYALEVLSDIPTTGAADIIMQRWENLWVNDKYALLKAVRGIGDRRFIGFLKKEMKEGEFLEAEVFILLCLVNRIIDPMFNKAEREIEKRNKTLTKNLKTLKSARPGKLLKEPLDIELRCRTCRRQYHYSINNIMVISKFHDNYIMDKVRCKNCGIVDNYEITLKGEDAILARMAFFGILDKLEKEDVSDGFFKFGRTMPIYGREMSLDEALAFYEKKLKDNPANVEYMIGYANLLRRAKRTGDAGLHYKNAAAIDPLAIEAYTSLGQIAEDRGDAESAYAYYKEASEMLHTAKFYKLTADRDEFREMVLYNLDYYEKKLGKKPVQLSQAPLISPEREESEEPETGMAGAFVDRPKVGRNAPCPCGSGKKYKKCCMQKESGRETAVAAATRSKEKVIMDRLLAYSGNKKFKKDFLAASSLYWKTDPVEPLILPERALEEKGEFIDWFITDYRLPSGKTIIEEYYSLMFNKLGTEEKAILEACIMSYISIYEVTDVMEGRGIKARDIFTEKELEVKEIRSSEQLAKWDIIMMRIYTLNGENRILSPSVRIIPRHLKDALNGFLNREFAKFKEETGKTEWSAFMKNRSYITEQYIDELPEEKKILLTEERHGLVFAKAHFNTGDFDEILAMLEAEYDFIPDEVTDKEARLTWLKRGKSGDWPESEEKHENGLIIQSKLMRGSGKLDWTVLGNIIIRPDILMLECMSKERLNRGKERLEEILGGLIMHRADTFEDVDKKIDADSPSEIKKETNRLPGNAGQIMEAFLIRNLMEWLDRSLPSLDGMTPREAVKTGDGKEKVIELLKDLENMEERKRKSGETCINIDILKKELGLQLNV